MVVSVPKAWQDLGRRGGATPWCTRSTSGRSRTRTATASATSTASAPGWATSSCSASTRCGSPRSTPPRWPTTATTWPIPRDVDPVFGDLATFDRLVADAHEHGIRVTIDLVPNHTSDQHEWFQAALDAAPGSPERARYHFRARPRPGRRRAAEQLAERLRRAGVDPGAGPGRPAGEWYLHLFAPEQPDLNWTNPEVRADLEKTLRFWLDRGVDGFRIDVAHGMSKPDDLPDARQPRTGELLADADPRPALRRRRRARHPPDDPHGARRLPRHGIAVGEVWVRDDSRFARYVRPDELHLGFNFRLVRAPFDADAVRAAIEHSLAAVDGGRRPADVDAVQPRRVPARHPLRRRRDRPRAGQGDDAGRAGAAGRRLPLQRRGARPARRRAARRGAAGPGLGALRPHPSGAATPAGCRSRGRAPRRATGSPRATPGCRCPGVRRAGRRGRPAGGHRLDAVAGPAGDRAAQDPPRLRRARTLEWFGAPDGCFAFRRTGTTLVCALNTSSRGGPAPAGRGPAGQRPPLRRHAPARHGRLAGLNPARVLERGSSAEPQQRERGDPPAHHRAVTRVQPQPGAGGRHPHHARRPGRCRRGTPSRTARTGSAAAPSPRDGRRPDTVSTVWSSSDAGGPIGPAFSRATASPRSVSRLQLRGRHVVHRLPARRRGQLAVPETRPTRGPPCRPARP